MIAIADERVSARVVGLDTLRFAAAGWVALSHGARAPIDRIAEEIGAGRWLGALNNGLFNGVAAVMVFFVVSGLVIHLPQAGGRTLNPFGHWARRLTRILPPVLVASAVVTALGPTQAEAFRGILWSIWCEIAYYAIYPALLIAFRRWSTGAVFLAATALSLAAIAATWPTSYHSQLALAPLILIGLPSWILGCILAERIQRGTIAPGGSLWAWRAGALALSALMKLPVTHGPLLIGYPAGHWLFAIFAAAWIEREIAGFRKRPPAPALEAAGAMSYSLYLVHMPVIVAFEAVKAANFAPLPAPAGEIARWAALVACIAAATYAFYLCVEAPSHRLARTLGRRVEAATARRGGLGARL
jgi:peptidoglycan/LPS O-acetylase OafA/YrhL